MSSTLLCLLSLSPSASSAALESDVALITGWLADQKYALRFSSRVTTDDDSAAFLNRLVRWTAADAFEKLDGWVPPASLAPFAEWLGRAGAWLLKLWCDYSASLTSCC
jgi:hypothetical protein